jgi:hypothetical protein
MSKRFSMSREDVQKIGQAFMFALVSALLAGLFGLLASPDVLPSWVIPLTPAINAFLYGIKRWLEDSRV